MFVCVCICTYICMYRCLAECVCAPRPGRASYPCPLQLGAIEECEPPCRCWESNASLPEELLTLLTWAISRYLSFAFLKSFSFLEKLIILVLFIYMFSLNISKCTKCMHSSWRQEGVRSPGAGVRNNCEASCGHRNPNSDPLQGSKCSSLFPAAQPSPHSWRLIYHFKLSGCGYAHVSAGAHRGQMHWSSGAIATGRSTRVLEIKFTSTTKATRALS